MEITTQSQSTRKQHVKVFGCGGCGLNIAHYYNNVDSIAGFANLSTVYIDTSRANVKPGMREDDIYLVKSSDGSELDGSGKIRRDNAAAIQASVKQILQKHTPGDFNIVVFSATGGSGSVISPVLMGELLARGESVVGVVVGSDESEITATNAVNTLKSLEGIARINKRSVVISYNHWERGTPRSDADDRAKFAITALSILMSGEFEELDSRDLINWLDVTKVGVAPMLSVLEIVTDTPDVDGVKHPISIASLYTNPNQPTYGTRPQYACTGYGSIPYDKRDALHYVISSDAVADVYKAVESDTNSLIESNRAHIGRASIVSDEAIADTGGLVF